MKSIRIKSNKNNLTEREIIIITFYSSLRNKWITLKFDLKVV